jgi:hypothetical protein
MTFQGERGKRQRAVRVTYRCDSSYAVSIVAAGDEISDSPFRVRWGELVVGTQSIRMRMDGGNSLSLLMLGKLFETAVPDVEHGVIVFPNQLLPYFMVVEERDEK